MLEYLTKNYTSYLGWGLNTFEDFLEAFSNYSDGGWWIRKIDYKDAFNREITEGPYKEKTAREKAEAWNKYFKYKDLKTAKVYNLVDLLCNHKDDYLRLKNHLCEEYIWRPPAGSELFCLIKGVSDVLLYYIKDIKNSRDLEKFSSYAETKGINYIKVKDYKIYYCNKSYISFEKAKKLKKLVIDFEEEKESIKWLYLEAINKNNYREGIKPLIIPEYIVDFNKDIQPQTLDFFKKLSTFKTKKEKIDKLIESLKNYKRNLKAENKEYDIYYVLPLIYNKNDSRIKNLNISYKNNIFKVLIKEEDYSITLTDSPIGGGRISFDFPYTRKIDYFDDKIIDLLFFISKILKIERLVIKDNLMQYCKCDGLDNMPLYINIIRFLASLDSIYETIGFKEIDKESRLKIVSKYKDKPVLDYTYGELAKDYLNGYCRYEHVCELLKDISTKIFEELKDICLEYIIYLDNIKLYKLRSRLDF